MNDHNRPRGLDVGVFKTSASPIFPCHNSDKYEMRHPVGRGKFSTVFRARRLSDGRPCALKKIRLSGSLDSVSRKKCLQEVQLLQSLNHPNIISYLDSFLEHDKDDMMVIVLEWAEAGDLDRQLAKLRARRSPIMLPGKATVKN